MGALGQGNESLVRSLLWAGSDPLAQTHARQRAGQLAGERRFFVLRNSLERDARDAAARQGVDLEAAQEGDEDEDDGRGVLPSLAGEGRRATLAKKRAAAARRRERSGMAQKRGSPQKRNTRLRMRTVSKMDDAPEQDDLPPTELLEAVKQLAPAAPAAALAAPNLEKLFGKTAGENDAGGDGEGAARGRWRQAGRAVVDRRGDFAISAPRDDAEPQEDAEAERAALSQLRNFPRDLARWTHAVELLENHGAGVNHSGGAHAVEGEEEPIAGEAAEFERLLEAALASGHENEVGIRCIRRRVEGAAHAFSLGFFLDELGP